MSTFEDICGNLESCDQCLIAYQKQTVFLNGIKNERFDNIKCSFDIKSFHETVLEFNKKAIKLVNSNWSMKWYMWRSNNTTTYNGTTDRNSNSTDAFKITDFTGDTYNFLSPDAKSWFGQLWKSAEAVKHFWLKYGGQHLGVSQRDFWSNQCSRREDRNNNGDNE